MPRRLRRPGDAAERAIERQRDAFRRRGGGGIEPDQRQVERGMPCRRRQAVGVVAKLHHQREAGRADMGSRTMPRPRTSSSPARARCRSRRCRRRCPRGRPPPGRSRATAGAAAGPTCRIPAVQSAARRRRSGTRSFRGSAWLDNLSRYGRERKPLVRASAFGAAWGRERDGIENGTPRRLRCVGEKQALNHRGTEGIYSYL